MIIDMGEQLIIIMLDAKSAFDVVVHNNMMRRLYHLGIQDKHWSLITLVIYIIMQQHQLN